jgi:ribosomal protein L25 (general stress protein Ctc)
MAERMTLEAAPRADFGKERMKKLRRDARIPV